MSPPSGAAQRPIGPARGPPLRRVQAVAPVDDPRDRDRAGRVAAGSSATYSGHSVRQQHDLRALPPRRRRCARTTGPATSCWRCRSRWGSVTVTVAPWSCSWAATLSAGESRTSSLSGLNAAPRTAIRRPTIDPPQTSRARSTMRTRRRMLIESTSRRKVRRLVDTQLARAGHEGPDVLRQASAAETDPGVEEPSADPGVMADRVSQQRDVGTGGLAELGHGVDERDLRGQERVGRDLDELCGREVRHDLRRALGQRGGVHLVELRLRLVGPPQCH